MADMEVSRQRKIVVNIFVRAGERLTAIGFGCSGAVRCQGPAACGVGDSDLVVHDLLYSTSGKERIGHQP